MALRCIVFLVFTLYWSIASAELCPKQCDCDLYNGLNRALCVDQNIVSIDVGVPSAVQVYSLNHNSISELDNFCFKVSLKIFCVTIQICTVVRVSLTHLILILPFFSFKNLQFFYFGYVGWWYICLNFVSSNVDTYLIILLACFSLESANNCQKPKHRQRMLCVPNAPFNDGSQKKF